MSWRFSLFCNAKFLHPSFFLLLKSTSTNVCIVNSFQIRYCTTPRQKCGLTRTSPRATTASRRLMPGSQSTTIPPAWPLPKLDPTSWGLTATTVRWQLTSCLSSSSSSSSTFNSRANYNSCSRSSRSITTSNSSFCSISNNRWLMQSRWCARASATRTAV